MSSRLGGGAAHVTPTRLSLYVREPERRSKHRAGLRVHGLWALGRARRKATSLTEHGLQAEPERVQFDVGLTRSAPDELWSNLGIANAVLRLHLE